MKKLIIAFLVFFSGFSYSQSTLPVVSVINYGAVANDSSKGAVNKTAIQGAIDSFGTHGGTVTIPCGFYYVNPGIVVNNSQKNITITGCSNGFGYESLVSTNTVYSGGTVIYFVSSGAIGFDFSQTSYLSGNYTRLTNIVISGGGAVDACIKVRGLVLLDHMNVQDCREQGIWLYELANGTAIDYVSSTNNVIGAGIGLFVGTESTTYYDNTKFSVSNSAFRQNRTGVRITQANGYSFSDTVIESNAQNGLELYKIHTTNGHDRNTNGRFDSVWIENNSASSNDYSNILIDASARSFDSMDTPSFITFENSTIVAYQTSTAGVFKQNIKIEAGQNIDFRNTSIQTADPIVDGAQKAPTYFGSYSSNIRFYNPQGNFIISDSGSLNSFDTSGYHKVGTFTYSLTGCTSTVTGVGYYSITNNVATVDLPNMVCTSNATTKTITGLPSFVWAVDSKNQFTFMQDNGGTYAMGWVQFSSGVFTMSKDGNGNLWTASGSFVARAFSMTYALR